MADRTTIDSSVALLQASAFGAHAPQRGCGIDASRFTPATAGHDVIMIIAGITTVTILRVARFVLMEAKDFCFS
ncbi:hypothetical protein AYJ54_37000 [Bradyrhizobium centrolobii]|uniref:Uncharacterized protein n=1 Tax=Bradyrhizobium centrolobii TaxID=1505087 RepID=A0A176Y5N8_9BRAD|nr:hypothetical protein [Bradyrhizobium centrolobii]OAE96193.1 hypothetical protein AYJ54_37000 [Bradyrhizobium centrolobii]